MVIGGNQGCGAFRRRLLLFFSGLLLLGLGARNGMPRARSSARAWSSLSVRGDEGDVEAERALDLVEFDLGEDGLVGDAEGVVAVAVERAGVHAAEVADARDGGA